MTYKLLKGVDKLYYALITQDDASAYAAGTPVPLAPLKLAVATPKTNTKTEYFDNQPMFAMSGEGETTLKLDITMLPLDVQAALLGKVYDAVNDSLYDNGGTPPDIALGFRALQSDGTYALFWYLKGNFKAPEEQAQTETDSPEPKGLSLEYTAVRTAHEFALDGSITATVKRRVSTKQADVATWFDAVRVPVVGSPSALTMTPSPADNATSVVVSVSPTLTFNNAMNGDVLNGIALIKASDDSPVACTITINAARTVVTIDPTSNLTAAAEHYISVVNATDIYGQTYANTVVSFTTA